MLPLSKSDKMKLLFIDNYMKAEENNPPGASKFYYWSQGLGFRLNVNIYSPPHIEWLDNQAHGDRYPIRENKIYFFLMDAEDVIG